MMKWIVCCGMQRSGSTLQYQIVTEILSVANLGIGMGFLNKNEAKSILSRNYPHQYIAVKRHGYHFYFEELEKKDKVIYIYSYRDIRDIAVSFMQKEKLPFEKVLNKVKVDRILSNSITWSSKKKYSSRYEEFSQNIEKEVSSISKYLGIELNDNEVSEIANKLHLINQREKITQLNRENSGVEIQGNTLEKQSLLHSNHIADGKIDKWKNVLSKTEIAFLEVKFGQWLNSYDYQLSLSPIEKYYNYFKELYRRSIIKIKNRF